MILLIDNYDSFTYNIVHYLAEIGREDVLVKRNDKISLAEITQLNPEAIIISPGPCSPNEAGICLDLIKKFKNTYPIFGICLGHQAIAQVFGANIIRADLPVHGKISKINVKNTGCFTGLPATIEATRYHSLIIERESLSDEFEITAETDDKIIMAIKHKSLPLESVQFHPESIGSEHGHAIFSNFLKHL
jgi:anthranilate synthase component II